MCTCFDGQAVPAAGELRPGWGRPARPGGGRWKLNLREGQAIPVHLRGRTVQLRPEFVRDVDEVEGLVRKMIAVNPRAAGCMPLVGSGGEIDRARVETALEFGFAIIRWHFATPVVRAGRHHGWTSVS